jgi:hypothetical protein
MGVGVYEINHPQWKEEGRREGEKERNQKKPKHPLKTCLHLLIRFLGGTFQTV